MANRMETAEATVTIRARAFNGVLETITATVASDGTVRVFDVLAGHYTTCHSLSTRDIGRIRAAAKRTTQMTTYSIKPERISADKQPMTANRAQIIQLQTEAGEAGDQAQVEICERALDGDDAAIAECARVIAEARTMGHFDAGREHLA